MTRDQWKDGVEVIGILSIIATAEAAIRGW